MLNTPSKSHQIFTSFIKEFGHFEIDTIVGKRDGKESVIMTLIERQTRFQIIRLIDGRDAD